MIKVRSIVHFWKMTTVHSGLKLKNQTIHDAIIDQLRACQTSDEILAFEKWFNSKAESGPLYTIICELLRRRSISRSTASKWFEALLKDRDERLTSK